MAVSDVESPLLVEEKVDWRVPLATVSCETPGVYCLSVWCPCVRFAQTATRAKLWPRRFGPSAWAALYFSALFFLFVPFLWPWCKEFKDPIDYAKRLALPWCGVWWLSLPLMAFIGALKRRDIRQKYNIKSCGFCEDCVVHACCEPCALAQEAAHVDTEELGQVTASLDISLCAPNKDKDDVLLQNYVIVAVRPENPIVR